MKSSKLFQVLGAIRPLPREVRSAIERELQFISLPTDYFLVQAHSAARDAYFLEEGFAVSYRLSETGKVVTAFWPEGSVIFSPRSFFEQVPSGEFIQLTTASKLYFLSSVSAAALFETSMLANAVARIILARYLVRCEERTTDLHELTPWERYSKLLKAYPRIEQNASQHLIASYLHITPQSLSRLKHKRKKFLSPDK